MRSNRRLELAPNGQMMVVPTCEHCGAGTLAVDSNRHGKYRECWKAYHGLAGCPGTDRFKTDPYAGVEFVPFKHLKPSTQTFLRTLYPDSQYVRSVA